MQEAKKSLIATGAVVAVVGAVIVGGLVRNRMEVGPGVTVGGPITMESLVSSTNGIPNPSEAAKNPISESTYFYQLTQLLEKEYVDTIKSERDLAIGAVRGMVNSLADSNSVFLKPDQMAAFKSRRNGSFEGIGVEVKLAYDEAELRKMQNNSIGSTGPDADINFEPLLLIPTVRVTAVVPGGPAERAGIRVGDRITNVNNKWALSSEELARILAIRAKFDAGEIDKTEFEKHGNEFRSRFESSVTPMRVTEELLLGKSGTVKVGWRSPGGAEKAAVIEKSVHELPAVELKGNVLLLRFFKDSPKLLEALALPDLLTIDLRQSTVGDYDAMRVCLALIAPSGDYGFITREQTGATRKLSVADSTAPARKISLIVDDSTWGAAAVFAEALVKSGRATIKAGKLSDQLPWIDTVELPDGSGYTLRTGTFVARRESK